MIRKPSPVFAAVLGGAVFATAAVWSQPAAAAEPYLGQMEYFAFNFAPRGWTKCDGQILPIEQNQSLFSLLGNTFGGDGRTSFALPDMRGRMPVHDGGLPAGSGLTPRPLGQQGGAESVVLTAAQLPSHAHTLRATTSQGNESRPAGASLADDNPDETYRNEAPNTDMHAGAIGATPSQSHDNMPPFLVVNCTIALSGIFPPRN